MLGPSCPNLKRRPLEAHARPIHRSYWQDHKLAGLVLMNFKVEGRNDVVRSDFRNVGSYDKSPVVRCVRPDSQHTKIKSHQMRGSLEPFGLSVLFMERSFR